MTNADDNPTIHTNPDPDDERTVVGQAPSTSNVSNVEETFVGHFRLIELIGRGGQGDVFRAHDQKLNRTVALKLLNQRAELSDDKTHTKMRARFEREAEAAARVTHSGICPIYEYGEDRGYPWIAMQLVEGSPLNEQIKRRRQAQDHGAEFGTVSLLNVATAITDPQDETSLATSPTTKSRSSFSSNSTKEEFNSIISFFEGAARALGAAHSAGLVHRDIKPANLMVTPDGQAVIMDFGLARDSAAIGAALTMTGEVMGTPTYMSPEQFEGNQDQIDIRTDIYALGVSLYEALTLQKPFVAATYEALRAKVMNDDVPDPRKFLPAIPRELAVVVLCALERNKERRYASAEAFADDLKCVRELKPIAAKPAGPMLRTLRFLQRHPAMSMTIGVVFLSLALIAGIFYVKSDELAGLNDDLNATNKRLGEKTTEAELNLQAAKVETKAKTAALTEYQRMADTRRLTNALRDARDLWPVSPAQITGLQDWLKKYSPLFARLDDHKHALETLRAEAGNKTLADGKPDFNDDADLHFRYDTLQKLVQDMEKSTADDCGVTKSIAKRLDWAGRIETETVKDHKNAWLNAARRVKANASYNGLELTPQLGLIPLGPDPSSGLEEFLHWQSHVGDLPSRGTDGKITVTESTGLFFVLLPGGDCTLGSQSRDPASSNYDPSSAGDEQPVNGVNLDAFFLSKYEMTQAQWSRATGKAPSNFPAEKTIKAAKTTITGLHPVERISQEDCKTVLRQLDLNLPTEAQWEYAARANSSFVFAGTSDLPALSKYANLSGLEGARIFAGHDKRHEDAYVLHAPIGTLLPNPWGFHNMIGNVAEWCLDLATTYKSTDARPGDGLRGVMKTAGPMARGGSFNDPIVRSRTAKRTNYAANNSSGAVGVRPARPLSQ